jgi:hypothetical protein
MAIASLMALLTALPVGATHNIEARRWDRQASGIYNYAPKYYFDADVPSACRQAFRNGAAKWNARNRELRYVEGAGATVYIRVRYQDLAWPWNDDLAFSELDAVTDITWQKINFNNNVDRPNGSRWFPYCGTGTPASDEYDFWSLSIHELGHNQIQNHTSSTSDIMYPTFCNGCTKRNLSSHDIASFNLLYPAAQ